MSSAWSDYRRLFWPLVVAIVCGVASVVIWRALLDQQYATTAARIAARQIHVQERVRAEVEKTSRALRRIADRWIAADGTPAEFWRQDAQAYLRDYAHIQAIGWADPDLVVRWIEPLAGNERAMDLDLTFEPNRRGAIESARDTAAITATKRLDLVQGGEGFLAFCPIGKGEDFDGAVLGVFRFDVLFDDLLAPYRDEFVATVYEGDRPIYQSADTANESVALAGAPVPFDVFHGAWSIQLTPRPAFVAAHMSSLPHYVLAAGLILSVCLACLVFVLGRDRAVAPSAEEPLYIKLGADRSQSREWTYFAVAALLMASPILINRLVWNGSADLHTLIELTATIMALFIGVVALAHHRARADNRFLCLAIAFVGAGALDGYHTAVTSQWFEAAFPSSQESLAAWSWTASRFYLAAAMLTVWLAWWREKHNRSVAHLHGTVIGAGVAAVILFTFAVFALVPLPNAYFPDLPFGRPAELLAGTLFVLALWGHLSARRWKTQTIDHWIVLSLIVATVSQIFLMPFSFSLFDRMFEAAHLAKLVSYGCVLAGVLGSTFELFRQSQVNVSRFAESHRDLSESQAVVQLKQALFQGILDHASAVVYVKDLDGRYILVNKHCDSLFNVSMDEIKGKTDYDIFPEETADMLRNTDLAVAKSGAVIEEEQSAPHDDGGRTYLSTKFPIYDETGALRAVAGISTEISDFKAARVAAHDALARLQAVMDAAPVVICMKDRDGRYTLVNRYYAGELGRSEAELIGKTDIEVFPGAKGVELHEAAMDVIRSGEPRRQEQAGPDQHGRIRTTLSHKVPLLDEQGAVVGVCTVAADVTGAQEAEGSLHPGHPAAQSAEQAKIEFLANMSHEIRTPMNGVIGMLDLLTSTELTSEQREYSEAARRSADVLLALINDILDASKLEAGAIQLEHIDFAPALTIEGVAELLRFDARERGVDIVLEVGGGVPNMVSGDPGRLRQVLLNLMGNAIKFTKDGEVTARVTAEEQSESTVRLLFEIEDTGIGIEPDRLDAIFNRFSQVDAPAMRQLGGAGLGLSICKSLVELMGGEMGVESTVGEGARFWFSISFRKTDAVAAVPVVGVIPLDGMNVLVASAIPADRKRFLALIEDFGFSGVAASSAAEALDRLRHAARTDEPFDAAIIDGQLRDMSGIDFVEELAVDEELALPKVILFSSTGSRGDAAHLRSLGVSAYLHKPVNDKQLFECLMAVFSQEDLLASGELPPLITQYSLNDSRAQDEVSILLVEDNAVNQRVAQAVLKNLGYRCDVVHDGREAVEAVRKKQYDLVLMDCQMPEMDGYAATKRIRALPSEHRGTRIIAMTANAAEGDREKCLAAGMDDYISKPINSNILAEAISRNLRRTVDREGSAT